MSEKPIVQATMIQEITGGMFTSNDLPERSKLYGLIPCGLGTVWQESLTGYLNRLAWRHHISPRHLVAQEIAPLLSQSYSRQDLASFSWSRAMSINGNGQIAREWASILENLTCRPDLHLLTGRWWIGDMIPYRLLRVQPAWCPACYPEWKDQDMPLYEPLLWTFQAVTMCMRHHRNLQEHCPRCQSRQSFIRFQTTLDQCVRCKTWLGSSAPSPEQPNAEGMEWQRWVLHTLEELRCAVVSSRLPPWEQFFTNLSVSCYEVRGGQSRLAKMAGVAREQLIGWLHQSQTPIPESILELCYVCNVTPLQVLTGDLAQLKQAIAEGKPYRSPRARRPFHPIDSEQCLLRIQAILSGREEPLGYVQLARQLGYSGRTLLHHFPQECALLSQQIKEHRRQRKEQRIAKMQEEVRQATLVLHAQGIYPSEYKVANLLSNPNLMFQSEAKFARRVLCQDLGWDRGNKVDSRKTSIGPPQNFS